eukprot:TRINITY_DN22921_c0_g1_i1.p1 TRINITY_DN22921_c0_g1~~TRINITY_DN22921_c0_g1_i1.p1  ORF type:complete len:313 (-),score=104.54 TRINITY_DN22921_c0_g1_i1:834-1772(-)
MNDLLGDGGGVTRYTNGGGGGTGATDIEEGTSGAPPGSDKSLAQFFEEVESIKKDMAEIRRNLHKLQEANEESKLITRPGPLKVLRDKMDADIDQVTKLAQGIKVKLESVERGNLESRKLPGCGEGSSTDRTRMSITGSLKKKLKELMDDFQKLKEKFQEEYKQVVERRFFTVTGKKADEETIEQMIETGESEQIFQKAIQEQGRGQILDTVAEIQERHDAVRDMEKKLLELHQIFMDMAVLVEAQGELLDNIETQVGKAVEHIQSGTKALVSAKKLQKSTRKWMCIAIIILLIVIAVVVVGVVRPWKKGKA